MPHYQYGERDSTRTNSSQFGFVVVTPPENELITVNEAKAHLRVDIDDEDTLIEGFIKAAVETCERVARRAFLTQTLRMTLDQWFPEHTKRLKRPPFQSVSAVRLIDWDGAAHVVDADGYWFDTATGAIRQNTEVDWPDVRVRPVAGIEIDYVAGYGEAADSVPQMYKQAALLLVGHWYENREATVTGQGFSSMPLPFAVNALLGLDRGGFF